MFSSVFMVLLALFLALMWGIAYALALEKFEFLRWLVDKRTWITVVIGIGVDLALMLLIVPFEFWWPGAAVIGLSAIGIIGRSIYLERMEWQELMLTIRGGYGERRRNTEDRYETPGE